MLSKAGSVHMPFETIHPFLDGNERVGRRLIPLMLARKVSSGALLGMVPRQMTEALSNWPVGGTPAA